MNINDEILKRIVDAVSKSEPDSEIYLYGSRARGDFKKISDWDLLILLNHDNISFLLETKLIDSLFEVELDIGEIISPIIYSKNEWKKKYSITPLFENIKREGIKVK
jgi:predicted nucleotidyltransferase